LFAPIDTQGNGQPRRFAATTPSERARRESSLNLPADRREATARVQARSWLRVAPNRAYLYGECSLLCGLPLWATSNPFTFGGRPFLDWTRESFGIAAKSSRPE